MSKTIHIITTDSRTEAVLCQASASVLRTVLNAREVEVTPFTTAYVTSIHWDAWRISGTIAVSDNDEIDFKGLSSYDGNEIQLEEIAYTHEQTLSFSNADEKFLEEIVLGTLFDKYNPEIYSQWLADQHDAHEDWMEAEATGN